MRSAWAILVLAAVMTGCGQRAARPPLRTLIFLTRDGCAMSGALRASLDAALRTLKTPISYQVIDEGTLPRTDPRSAYPTPTLLYADRDLFGLAKPVPPFPEPT